MESTLNTSVQETAASSQEYSSYPSSQCPDEFVDSEDEEDEIIEALGACQLGEGGATSHLSDKQGSLRLCTRLTRCKMDLYHCVYVYTIITAVNWRQNGQSSHRDYLTLARRWRPSRSRLSFSPLLYIHFDTVLSNIDLITPTGRRTNTRQSVERRDSAFLNANAATLHSRSHVFETQLA